MNVTIRAKDSFVHNDITMAKREERAVPEAQAKALIDGGLAVKVTERTSTAAARTPAARRAPTSSNKMAPTAGNKAAGGTETGETSGAQGDESGAAAGTGEDGTGKPADSSEPPAAD